MYLMPVNKIDGNYFYGNYIATIEKCLLLLIINICSLRSVTLRCTFELDKLMLHWNLELIGVDLLYYTNAHSC